MPPFADGQFADPYGADGRAHQLRYLAFHGFQHAPDLPVPALGDGHLEVRVFRSVAQALDFRRPGDAVA